MPEWVKTLVAVSDALIPPLALVVAALAWLVKLRWSREFVAAKDAQIASLREETRARLEANDEALKAKEVQLETLRLQMKALEEQTAPKLVEVLLSTKKGYEAFTDVLDARVKSLEAENGKLTERIEHERRSGSVRVAALEEQRDALEQRAVQLREQIDVLRARPQPHMTWGPGTAGFEAWRTAQYRQDSWSVLWGGVPFDDAPVWPKATDVSGGSALGQQLPIETRTEQVPPVSEPDKAKER